MPDGFTYDDRGEPMAAPSGVRIPAGISTDMPLPPGSAIVGKNVVDVGFDVRTPAEWAVIRDRMDDFDRRRREAEQARVVEEALAGQLQAAQASRRANEYKAAIAGALQFQESRALRNALDAGVPPAQAIARHFRAFGTGRDAAAMLRATAPPLQPRVVDFEGIGPAVVSGRFGERVQFPARTPPARRNLTPSEMMRRAADLDALVNDPLRRKGEPDSPETAEARRELAEINRRLRALSTGAPATSPPAPAPVRVRRKSDGALFDYSGSADEVPADRYEIVAP